MSGEKEYKSRLDGLRSRRMSSDLQYGNVHYALVQSNGIIGSAAKMLKCSRKKLNEFIDSHPELKEASSEGFSELIDIAQDNLAKQIKAGDPVAIRFFLSTKGGYNQRTEHTGKDGKDLFEISSTQHEQNLRDILSRVGVKRGGEDSPESTVH